MPAETKVPGVQTLAQTNQQLQQLSQGWFEAQLFKGKPAVLTTFQGTVHNIADYFNQILSVLQGFLQLSKTFTVSLVNPINSLIAETLKAVQSAIRDIDQLGLYFTSDYPLLTYPFSDVLGGYTAYERRMLSKLTDRLDPNRPSVSPETMVMAVFFYATAETTGISNLTRTVQQFMRLFNINTVGETLPACGPIKPLYKNMGVRGSFANLSQAYRNLKTGNQNPTALTLQWQIARSNRMGSITIPMPPADGFILEVSTVPQGLALFCNRKKVSDGRDVSKNEARESVIVRSEDDAPIILYGGAGSVQIPQQNQATSNLTSQAGQISFKPGSTFYFAKRSLADTEIIALDQLYDAKTGRHYLQRTFLIDQVQLSPSNTYEFVVEQKDLPYNATFETTEKGIVRTNDTEQPSTYYLRVAAVSDYIRKSGTPDSAQWALRFDCSATHAASKEVVVPLIWGENLTANRGRPSEVATVTFPTQYTNTYLESVRVALFLLALLRIDTKPLIAGKTIDKDRFEQIRQHQFMTRGAYAESVFGECTLNGLDQVLLSVLEGQTPSDFYAGKNLDPSVWVKKVTSNIQRIIDKMYAVAGSDPALEKFLSERTVELRTTKLEDLAKLSKSPGILSTNPVLQSTLADFFQKFYQAPEGTGIASGISQLVDLSDREDFLASETLDLTPFPYYGTTQWTIVGSIDDATARAIYMGTGWKGTPTTDNALVAFDIAFKRHMAQEKYTYGAESEYDPTSKGTEKKWLHLRQTPIAKQPFLPDGPPLLYSAGSAAGDSMDASTLYAAPFRRLFTDADGTEHALGKKVLEQALLILNVITAVQNKSSQTSAWYALRLGDRLPGLSDMLLRVNQFMLATNVSLGSSANLLQEYIDFLSARIREIQQLLTQIDRLTQQLTFFETPKCAALVVFAKGSDDITSKFIGASNKPQDSALSYGAGGCIVVPTVPGSQFVLDLLLPKG